MLTFQCNYEKKSIYFQVVSLLFKIEYSMQFLVLLKIISDKNLNALLRPMITLVRPLNGGTFASYFSFISFLSNHHLLCVFDKMSKR